MPPRVIKLGRKDDIASVVKQIRSLKDREIVFDLEKGSILLKNSDTLKLMKRTAEALGKSIRIITDDEIGKVLAKKVGVLADGLEVSMPRMRSAKVARSDVHPRFSDIGRPKKAPVVAAAKHEDDDVLDTDEIYEEAPSRTKFPVRISKKLIAVVAVMVLLFFAAAVLLPSATITVYARSEPVSRDLEITVDTKASSIDQSKLVIPGIELVREVSQTKNFETTGNTAVGQRATGTVMIYNFTPYTLTLKAATTTLLINGKKYAFTKDATGIRASKRNGTVVDQSTGTGPIQIIADQAGVDYNLEAGTRIEIVNPALGNQDVYAVASTTIMGGNATNKLVLSQEDIDMAREALSVEILTEAEADLSEEQGKPIRVLGTGVNKQILADTANKEVGAETDNFDMTLIAKVTGIAFAENDVSELVIAKINEVLSNDKYLVEDAKQEYTATFKSLDIANGRGVLAVHFETLAAYKVDNGNLTKILSGKTAAEIREILLSKPEVDSVKVQFWPQSLVHKAPRFNGRITIKTVLSE